MSFTLPPLPYPQNALEPHISARTLEFHHGKHHKTYVDTLNKLVEGTEYASKGLEEIIQATYEAEEPAKKKIFNNAGQIWNHNFFWQSMKPNGGGEPDGEISQRIHADFGSWQDFRKAFVEAAAAQFGSGWAWLVESQGKLKIVTTANAVTPIAQGQKPLLVCDVWEHAYYLDYQNLRAKFVEAFLDHLVNWSFATECLRQDSAASGAQPQAVKRALAANGGEVLRSAETGGVEGEGSYSATRKYNTDLARSVAKGQAEYQAQQARRALDSSEGEELRRAEETGKRHSHGEDPALRGPRK